MFRTSTYPSSGGTSVFMRHFVLVILYSCLSGIQDGETAYQSQLYRIASTKCLINTDVPPDDGRRDVRNV